MNEIIFFYIDFLTEIVFKLDPFPIIDVFIINILFVAQPMVQVEVGYGVQRFKIKKIEDLQMDLMEPAMV